MRSILSDGMVTFGRRLIVELDEADIVFGAAFWLLDQETHGWQLTLASRLRQTIGPLTLYTDIQRRLIAMGAERISAIDMVTLIDDRGDRVRDMIRAVGSAKSVDGTRLDGALIGGTRLAGCLLYRVKPRQRLASDA